MSERENRFDLMIHLSFTIPQREFYHEFCISMILFRSALVLRGQIEKIHCNTKYIISATPSTFCYGNSTQIPKIKIQAMYKSKATCGIYVRYTKFRGMSIWHVLQ